MPESQPTRSETPEIAGSPAMLQIDAETLRKAQDIRQARERGDKQLMAASPDYRDVLRNILRGLLQTAIELEHSTIPPYLCAYFTLKPATNQEVADVIRSVVIEEMLHMSIAANVLIAIGGSPQINRPGFVPSYPGGLPFGIAGVEVNLQPCSIPVIRDTFMKIEAPAKPVPIDYSRLLAAATGSGRTAMTIGEYYTMIKDFVDFLGDGIFEPDRFALEMVDNKWFPPDELFRIENVKTACAAIDMIIKQGEGTPEREALKFRHEWTAYVHRKTTTKPAPPTALAAQASPLDPQGKPAHYYRFEEIVAGRKLVRDPRAENNFAFTGPLVALDPVNVWKMQCNPDPDKLPLHSNARRLSVLFAYSYTRLLDMLHETFNGRPAAIDDAIGQMYELRILAQEVLAIPSPITADRSTGLCFRYQPTATEEWPPASAPTPATAGA